MSDSELIYDELYAEMVTSPIPPVEIFAPWPTSIHAAPSGETQELPVITGIEVPC